MNYEKDSSEEQELIQKFLKKELSSSAHSGFIESMKENKDLAREVAFQEALLLKKEQAELVHMQVILADIRKQHPTNEVAQSSELDLLENELELLQSNDTGLPSKPIQTRNSLKKWLGIGLFLGLSFLLGIWWMQSNSLNFNKAVLATAASKELRALPNILSFAEGTTGPLVEGMSAYEKENYVMASQYLQNHLARNPDDQEAQLYTAIAALLANKTPMAITTLKPLTKVNKKFIAKHSRWYLALAYLKNEQPDLAEPLLLALSNDATYAAQAKKLLQH